MPDQTIITQDGIHLSTDDSFRAILANKIAYCLDNPDLGDTSSERFHNTIDNLQEQYPQFQHQLHSLEVLESNQDAIYLRDPSSNISYGVIRGTDLSHFPVRDLVNDAQIAVGEMTHRADSVFTCYQKLLEQSPHDKWEFVGHSLGGTIAEEIGTRDTNVKVTAFDPGRNSYLSDLHKSQVFNNIVEHRILHDPITGGRGVAERVIIHDTHQQVGDLIHNIETFHPIANYTDSIATDSQKLADKLTHSFAHDVQDVAGYVNTLEPHESLVSEISHDAQSILHQTDNFKLNNMLTSLSHCHGFF